MKISPWLEVKDQIDGVEYIAGMTRILEGGNIARIEDRVAFIEKTPRIRIRSQSRYDTHGDYLNWAARDWSGKGPTDPESKAWCDEALKVFGYTDV